jgi:class 3 adenylate cyclase
MSWDEQRARERVAEHDFNDLEVNVSDLSREMDFHNLGTKDVRRVQGTHLYADVSNFHDAVADAKGDSSKLKKLLRAASILRRMQAEFLKDYDSQEIQLQGARLHCLVYKPYDDEATRAKQSVLLAISLNSYLYDVFNSVFQEVRDFAGAIGIAAGKSLVANIGFRGERELISLGTCANLGAKVLDGFNTITITDTVYGLLPAMLQKHFKRAEIIAGVLTYRTTGLRWSSQPELAQEFAVDFDAEKLTKRTEEYRDALPLADMDISDAEVLIDVEKLSERNSKKTSAVALYADLDGFTKYVQQAEKDEEVVSLVRTLHMIRAELHAVISSDYPGLVLQHQGDRTFAIVHLPAGDQFEKRCNKGIDIASAIQSSMEHVLNERLGDRKNIHVAIGLAIGTVIVSRLGKKGAREVVCFGPSVTTAEALQLRSVGRDIRLTQKLYDTITNETVQKQFTKDSQGDYVAKRLTFPKLDEIEEDAAAREGRLDAPTTKQNIRIEIIKPSSSSVSNHRPWLSSPDIESKTSPVWNGMKHGQHVGKPSKRSHGN